MYVRLVHILYAAHGTCCLLSMAQASQKVRHSQSVLCYGLPVFLLCWPRLFFLISALEIQTAECCSPVWHIQLTPAVSLPIWGWLCIHCGKCGCSCGSDVFSPSAPAVRCLRYRAFQHVLIWWLWWRLRTKIGAVLGFWWSLVVWRPILFSVFRRQLLMILSWECILIHWAIVNGMKFSRDVKSRIY